MTSTPFYFILVLMLIYNPVSNIQVPNSQNKGVLKINNGGEAIIGKWITLENNLELSGLKWTTQQNQ